MEYLVKSHTVENDIVLDFTMGQWLNRRSVFKHWPESFIGIELDTKHYNTAKERLKEIDMYE